MTTAILVERAKPSLSPPAPSRLAEIFDPIDRAHIRGDAAVDDEELELVKSIEVYAMRARREAADDLIRRLRLLSRYEGRGLLIRRRAEAELRTLRGAVVEG